MPKSKELIGFERKYCKQHKGRICSSKPPCKYFIKGDCIEWTKRLKKLREKRGKQ